MAVYGLNFFGVARFGRDPEVVRPDFSVEPFLSSPLDYQSLYISWTKPVSADCLYLRLVRNRSNLPQDENDGIPLWGDLTTTPTYMDDVLRAPNFTDVGLGSGFQYYSMFGWSNSDQEWVRCSDLIGLVPVQYGYGDRFYNLIPMAYRDRDYVMVSPYNPWPVTSPQPPLKRYLALLGFEMDFIRTELESLRSINDPMNCSGTVLPLLAQQLGLVHEPEIGMMQERQLIQNAVHLYKIKGSPRGITEFAAIMTSYPSTALAHHGYNELLTTDDSAFLTSTGTWQAWPPVKRNFPSIVGNTGLALTWVPNLLATTTGGALIIPNMTNPVSTVKDVVSGQATYPAGLPDEVNPPYANGGMGIHGTAAAQSLYITTGGIPITDFVSSNYQGGTATFRFQIWSPIARTVEVSLWGDNGSGIPVPVIAAVTFNTQANTWVKYDLSGPINPYPNQPPLGTPGPLPYGPASYYWLFPRVRIENTAANETHYTALNVLWPCPLSKVGADTPVYDYPRDIKITIQPQYTNLLSNPVSTFTRPNPNYNDLLPLSPTNEPWILIGYDGLSNAIDPLVPNGALSSAAMSVRYQSIEDQPQSTAVYGDAALQVQATGTNATVWFGKVNSWSTPPPSPDGWFSGPRTSGPTYKDGRTNDWFFGSTQGFPNPREWFDPVYDFWFDSQNYYATGDPTSWVNGTWFPPPPQPTYNGNLSIFSVQSGQPFNFSVWARYLTVADPSNAFMTMGLRWYYADGTWAETSYGYTLTSVYPADPRYDVPPTLDTTYTYLGNPPPQANPSTGLPPVGVIPFVRFTRAQNATFLLNAAMLSPGLDLNPFIDSTSYPAASGDFMVDPVNNASYVYRRRIPRTTRLTTELYRWLPAGSTYSLVYGAGAVQPPLDPTLW